ncbi:MAG: restriction endonuclease [Saccharospirillaceae bacterium]|nr:restriction endonuclease [Pseudomonadales bacterium]NRB80084.1 restriction endonuclease [Saccharospirillaceae bacterium]
MWNIEILKFINKKVPSNGIIGQHIEETDVIRFVNDLISVEKEEEPSFDDVLDGYEYEYYCAELLRMYEWDARVTQGSGDQGVDVIATKEGVSIGIQCKMYHANPVGNKAVQEISSGIVHYKLDLGVVITNDRYTKSAKELAESTGVLLIHHDEIFNLDELIEENTNIEFEN